MMTVAELIEHLKGFPQDLKVKVPVWEGSDWGYEDDDVYQVVREESVFKHYPDTIVIKAWNH